MVGGAFKRKRPNCSDRARLVPNLFTVVLASCGTVLVTLQLLLMPQTTTRQEDPAVYEFQLGTELQTWMESIAYETGSASSAGEVRGAVPPGNSSYRTRRDIRIWPSSNSETDDRIVSQLEYIKAVGHGDAKENKTLSRKLILVYNGYPEGILRERLQFHHDQCPVRACALTDNRNEVGQADVILFQGTLEEPVIARPPGQIWVLYLLESPVHTQTFEAFKNKVNWTATYRTDSTIVTPYEKFVTISKLSNEFLTVGEETPVWLQNASGFPETKTGMVAWFVSNCATDNGRYEYAKALSRYIQVDIYGTCGHLKCPKDDDTCFQMLKTKYKFYLAFENSNCKGYITEKFFRNALLNDVIPVVMGAHIVDYQRVAPPHSFIHVDEYRSPRHLAIYLHRLANDYKLYSRYFQWRGTGHFINTKFWCRLCAMVHHVENHVTWYEDLDDWWKRRGTCVRHKRGRQWATWKRTTYSSKQEIV